MIYLLSFLFCGLVCLIGEILYLNTKLSPGHITSIFVICGVVLGFFQIYDFLIDYCGAGASILILNFGNLLVKGGTSSLEGGIGNIFSHLFDYVSLILSLLISISVFISLISLIRKLIHDR
jgi:stage V sporulation protein AE